MTDKEREFIIEKRKKYDVEADKNLKTGFKICGIVCGCSILILLATFKLDAMDNGTWLNCLFKSVTIAGTSIPSASGILLCLEKTFKSAGLSELLEDFGIEQTNEQEQVGKSR